MKPRSNGGLARRWRASGPNNPSGRPLGQASPDQRRRAFANPRAVLRPGMVGLAQRAIGDGGDIWNAGEAERVGVDTRRNRTARLRAIDHDAVHGYASRITF